jgi:poly-gamma-glutamate synthesis protein (capsule biosynthesis protein)
MPAAKTLLILGLTAGSAFAQNDARLLFTGDVLLSRQVRQEIERTGRFPWAGFEELFHSATWVAGNLEGAVGGPEECSPAESASPCFDIPAMLIPLLSQAGFRAMGIANNHAADLGAAGIEATRSALRAAGIDALGYRDSPHFLTIGGHSVAVIALSAVPGRDGARVEIPSLELRQKLRLAHNLAEIAIVFVHWGSELLDWPNVEQRRAAEWLAANGADLIVGHHPHVVQAPECVAGKPVFYSLGNHVFDQKYPATKQGLIADCRIHAGTLTCGGIATATPMGSSFPRLADGGHFPASPSLDACPVPLGPAPAVNGVSLRVLDVPNGYVIEGAPPGARPWRSQVLPLVSAEIGKLAGDFGPDLLFTLEQHYSSIDREEGVRPYVYEVRPAGLLARWRGSALAWPLLDAALQPGGGVLCALHRRDSFVELKPGSQGFRIAAYRWQGFGFAGVDDAESVKRCEAMWGGLHQSAQDGLNARPH